MYSTLIANQRVFTGCCSDVSIPIPVSFDVSINRCYHHVMSDVKFAFEIKKRPLYVSLNNISSVCSIGIFFSLLQYFLNVIEIETHGYPVSSVTILSWFDYPSIVLFNFVLVFVILLNFFGSLMIIPQKLEILLVLQLIFDVKSQRKKVKNIKIIFFIILAHGIKQCLFIADYIVIN